MTPTLILLSNFAYGWEIKTNNSGQGLHWDATNIHYSINTDGNHGLSSSAVESAIVEAANAWNQGSTQMVYDGGTKKTGADYSDGVHSVVFKDSWTEDPSVLAITYTWSTAGGEIVHFDMEINSDDHDWSTDGAVDKQDLTNAIAHEFGHAIGLDHSDDTEATMAADAIVGETNKRDINSDDLAGYQYIYENNSNHQNGGNSSNSSNGNAGTGGGTSGLQNHNGQTGNGMVPLDNAGCASTGSRGQSGLWWVLLTMGFITSRSKK